MWSGIGRVVNLTMYGLTVREALHRAEGPGFLDRLSSADLVEFPPFDDPPDLRGYIDLALRGGFPEPVLRLGDSARQAWLESYIDQLVSRHAENLDGVRDRVLLRRYFEALCVNTAGIVQDKTVYDAAGISRMTAGAYERLLADLFVFEALPAWNNNRLSRLVKSSKRYLTDPSLVAAALHLDERAVLRDGDVLGRVIDTFVLSQIRPEAELSTLRPRLYHLGEKDGRHEVDLLAELSGGDVIAIEVTATASPVASDARHLAVAPRPDRWPVPRWCRPPHGPPAIRPGRTNPRVADLFPLGLTRRPRGPSRRAIGAQIGLIDLSPPHHE